MKKINILLTILFVSLLLIGNVSALFPVSHKYVFDQAMKADITSTLFTDCKKHLDLCYAGSELVDVSVLYYYSNNLSIPYFVVNYLNIIFYY